MSTLESEGDQAIRRIVGAQSIDSKDDFSQVLALMALLFINNPKFREQRDNMMSEVAKVMMHNMVASQERWDSITRRAKSDGVEFGDPIPYAEMRKAVESGSIVPKTSNHVLVSQELELWPEIIPILEARKWILLIADKNSGEFATADKPCSLSWNDQEMQKGPYGVGLGITETTISFPLSRNLALIGQFENGDFSVQATREHVAALNIRTVMSSMRQVYSGNDFPILDVDSRILPFSESRLWRENICNRPQEDTDGNLAS